MVLPFKPLSLSFDHVNYYVDMPAVSNSYISYFTVLLIIPYSIYVEESQDIDS